MRKLEDVIIRQSENGKMENGKMIIVVIPALLRHSGSCSFT